MNEGIELVFFVYGLAFFSMGLALLMEAGRSPFIVEGRILRPLAFFGLVHGFHEWYELYLMRDSWLAVNFPEWVGWIRLFLLVLSFSLLIAFGVQAFSTIQKVPRLNIILPAGLLVIFILTVFLDQRYDPHESGEALAHVDVLARYLLGVTGACLAGLVLGIQGTRSRANRQEGLSVALWITAVCFVIYGFTQLVVAPQDFFPANWLNTTTFIGNLGFPIQVVRAAVAVAITLSLLRAVQLVDEDRRLRFERAQKDRLDTLEQLRQELENREVMRQELTQHIVLAQEAERTRVARELHDETAQFLTAFSLQLASLDELNGKDNRLDRSVRQLKQLSNQMAQSIYRLIHDLRPAQLDDLGLVPALDVLKEEIQQNFGMRVQMVVSGLPHRLDNLIETVVFRVCQEALINAARHAKVEDANLLVEFTEEAISLEICDQGQGFDLADVFSSKGAFGLAGMRERVEAVNGIFEIEASPGRGCKVRVKIAIINGNNAQQVNAEDQANNGVYFLKEPEFVDP